MPFAAAASLSRSGQPRERERVDFLTAVRAPLRVYSITRAPRNPLVLAAASFFARVSALG